MKTLRLARLLVIAAALIAPAVAQNINSESFFSPADSPQLDSSLMTGRRVGRGMLRYDVVNRLGRPSVRLTPNVWIYWNFKGTPAAGKDNDTLIIEFVDDRISLLKLSPSAPVRALLAQQPAKAVKKAIALKQVTADSQE